MKKRQIKVKRKFEGAQAQPSVAKQAPYSSGAPDGRGACAAPVRPLACRLRGAWPMGACSSQVRAALAPFCTCSFPSG